MLGPLHGQHDYHLLERLLLLDEEQLYALTVHRFAPHFTRQPRPFSVMNGEMQQLVKRAGLQYEYIRQFFSDERHCRVCPRCLDEGNGYDRLYWRCELLLYCPRHRVFLVHRCPACHAPIPSLRLSLTRCPACQIGDYRTHIFPLLPEDGWLERVHITLLRNLGIDGPEVGAQIAHGSKTALDGLPSWDYFRVLVTCASFLKPLERSGVDTFRSFTRTLPPETLISRLSKNVGISSYKLLPSIFAHYLSTDWPYHMLVFIERLQRLLQEEFHYAPTSAVVHKWSQMMVHGNYWCVQSYREQPVSQLIDLLGTYTKRFESLPTAETAEDHHGGILVNERLVLEWELHIKTLDKAIRPSSWESLPSLLARVADKMGYRRTEGIWHSHDSSVRRYRLSPGEILLLQRSDDYRFMEETLLLEKDILYTLTLHRFASALQPPSSNDPLPRRNALWNTGERQLLLEETVSRFCLPSLTTRVCPACLEEKHVYERLYWNIRPVLICPHHQLFLVDRCPKCHWLIPAMRRTVLWECSYCNRGDYRSAKRTTLTHDSLLYQSQRMFLHQLGIDEPLSKDIPALFQNSPLKSLQPWEYFDMFNCFGSVAPYLRPERTLTSRH